MEVKRRDFLKTGVTTLGAASLGIMAAGVVSKKGMMAKVQDFSNKSYH